VYFRNSVFPDEVTVVGQGPGPLGVDAGFQSCAPVLDAGRRREVELVGEDDRPAGGAGIQAARVLALPVVHPLGQPGALILTRRLVAVGHERERRVVAVGLEDALPLLVQPRVQGAPVPDRGTLVGPGGTLDLVVETQLVGGDERGLGGTPGVEADVIQPVGLADANDTPPGGHAGRRVPGQREDAALERAAKKRPASVNGELRPVGAELAEAEDHGPRFRLRASCSRPQFDAQFVKVRVELIPGTRGCTQVQFQLDRPPGRRPRGLGPGFAQAPALNRGARSRARNL